MPLKKSNSEDVTRDLSSDAAEESTSVVDSSLTKCKNDIENFDDPRNSSYGEHEKCYDHGVQEQVYSSTLVENLDAKDVHKQHGTRYFVIKSLNHQNIQLSIEKGIWATQVMNEHILEEAFHNSDRVVLIFSVNMSGFFQGYAQMMSSVGWRRDNVWTGLSGGSNPWGSTFKVKWLQLNNLPFQKTLHLKNPLNDFKPVKISRDCQELSPEIGEALCDLIDGRFNVNSTRKRNNFMDEFLERPCVESSEGYVHTIPPSHAGWLYPSLLYQNVGQPQTSDIQVPNDKFIAGSIHKKCTLRPTNDWQLSSKRCTIMDSLSEDDFLSMTYEEYLQQTYGRNSDLSQYLDRQLLKQWLWNQPGDFARHLTKHFQMFGLLRVSRTVGPSRTSVESSNAVQDEERNLQHPASWY